jgi:hypothetical protein
MVLDKNVKTEIERLKNYSFPYSKGERRKITFKNLKK